MIKCMAETNKGKVLILGITPENVERLYKDKPIIIDGAGLAIPGLTVILLCKKTEEEIVVYLRSQGVKLPDGAEAAAAMVRAPKERQ